MIVTLNMIVLSKLRRCRMLGLFIVAMTRSCKLASCFYLVFCQMSFDDTDHDINDIVLVILKPRSLTAAARIVKLD